MRYESYKSSGVAWLGEIPEHWEVKPLRSVLQARNEKNDPIKTNQILSLSIAKGVTLYSDKGRGGNKAKSDLTAYKLAYPDDIVMNSMNVIVGAVGLSKYFGAISPVYYALRVRSQSQNIHFYDKIFSNRYFQNYLSIFGKGILIKESSSGKLNTIRMKISMDDLKKVPLPLPPLEEQEAIIRYLNFYEHKINKAIHVKKKLIATLSEQKQAIIAHAVTKGVDLHVKMKKSGISWLGEIPEHWEVKKLRTILKPIAVRNKPDLPLLSVVREKGIIVRDTENKEENHNFIPEDLSNYKVVKNGQFVMNKMKAWQGSYGVSSYDGIVSPAYYVFDLKEVSSDFFHKALRSKVYVPFFTHASDGVRIGQWDLSQSRMKEIPFWIPSIEEQKVIVEFIEQETVTIDKAIELSKKEIELLQEYKTRLIADVVTGAVDVRKEAQNLPEVEEDSIVFEDDVFEAQEEGGDE